MTSTKIAALAIGLAAAVIPAAAVAAPPSYAAPDGPPPTYARPNGEQSIRGTIVRFEGKYGVTLRDQRGYVDNIMLHQGTVILPTGLALQQGMQVEMYGTNAGSVFAANEVDLRSPFAAFVPVPEPAFGIGIGFGFGHHWR